MTIAMPSTGDRLRTERERRKLTVSQVAEATNIKADHVRAIEADDWGAFSAPVYVRGFVKTYARYLRLNDREVAAQLDEELAGRTDFREARGQAPADVGLGMHHRGCDTGGEHARQAGALNESTTFHEGSPDVENTTLQCLGQRHRRAILGGAFRPAVAGFPAD